MDLALDELTATIRGAISIEPGQQGTAIHRTTPLMRAQIADRSVDFVSGVTSGVRIQATTDAEWIDLDLALTRIRVNEQEVPELAMDVIVDGELGDPILLHNPTVVSVNMRTGDISIAPAGPETVRIPIATTPGERDVEIWLPHGAQTEIVGARISDDATFRPQPSTAPTWVHYGSSISQCSEADRPIDTWPAIVARHAGRDLTNLALAGQCQLDQQVARTIVALKADVISLELGINVTATMHDRTFISAVHGFLDTLREHAPMTPVLIITPIFCGPIETYPGPALPGEDGKVHAVERPAELLPGALSLHRIRQLLEQAVAFRQAGGDENIALISGLDLFGEQDADDLPDNLHPNTRGYGRMADRFYPRAFGTGGFFE